MRYLIILIVGIGIGIGVDYEYKSNCDSVWYKEQIEKWVPVDQVKHKKMNYRLKGKG